MYELRLLVKNKNYNEFFFLNIYIKKSFENDWLDMIMQFSDICE